MKSSTDIIAIAWRHIRNGIMVVLVLAVFAFYMRAFYPGYLTADMVYMLNMATGAEPVSNWHPLFDIAALKFLMAQFQHVPLLWTVQAMAWIAAAVVVAREFPRVAPVVFLALTLLPPLAANMAALWKDCWAVIFTTLTLAYCLRFLREGGLAGAACIACAAVTARIRIDYLVIVLPMLVACGLQLAQRMGIGDHQLDAA